MTFGQTLKQLLTLSGIKSAHLAEALGYDTSYISRWVNDVKLPSLKNNDDLFAKIARVIVEGSDEAAMERLSAEFGAEYAWLEEALESALKTAYDDAGRRALAPRMNPNAVFLHGGSLPELSGVFSDAILRSAAESREEEVQIAVTTPLSIYGNRYMGFWRQILSSPEIGGRLSIIVNQFVDMADFEQNADVCCAAICTLARFDRGVRYEFFQGGARTGGMPGHSSLIGSSLLCRVMPGPFSQESDLLLCSDPNVLRRFGPELHSALQLCPRLVSYCSRDELESSHFLYDFVMSGSLRYLLSVMHPIYMSDELVRSIAARHVPGMREDDFQVYYNSLCSNARREVILYRTALLEYIYSGRIFLFGRIMQLDREMRVTHLSQLLDNIHSGQCVLKILNDDNPILRRRDTGLSVYLSRSTGFMASNENDWYTSLKLSSACAVSAFNTFFSHLWSLGDEYELSGSDAEDFIRRGLALM